MIFEFDPRSGTYTKKRDFSLSDGSRPYGSLSLLNGKFYGMTQNGGANNKGVIFEWDPVTNNYNKKIEFDGTNGSLPYATLTYNGIKFYGMTVEGGVNNAGVIFEWDPVTNQFDKKIDLDPVNGSYPRGSLLLNQGLFYGMTERGGTSDLGVIFQWDPVSNQYTKQIDFDGNNGSIPVGNLTAGPGTFYGMTNTGGINNEGVIFEWQPAGNVYTKNFDFSFDDGKYPLGSLTWSGGKLYGTTQVGGASDRGVFFEWDPVSNTYIKKQEFGQEDGNGPGNGNDLILAPAQVATGTPDNCVDFPPITIDNSNNNSWVSIVDDKGDAVAEINANGNNLGVITASTYINSGSIREDDFKKLYLDRNLTISPEHQPTSAIDIRIYIKNLEFDRLKNSINSEGQSSGISNIDDIGIYKNSVGCSESVVTTTELIDPSAVTWESDHVLLANIISCSSFYFANKNQGGALPLSNLEFFGRLSNGNSLLNWKTTDELNAHLFELERSLNGRNYFAITSVAAINHAGVQLYDFVDKDVTGLNVPVVYYRIKQKDIDGRFNYSQIVALSIGNKNTVLLYPNPVTDKANLTINVTKAQLVQVKLVDYSSRIMLQQQFKLTAGTNAVYIDMTPYSRGAYQLELKGELLNERKQLIKQ